MKHTLRFLSVILTLCILTASLSSCMTVFTLGAMKDRWDNGVFSPKEDQAWKEFTLTDEDKDRFEALLDEIREQVKDGAGFTAVSASMVEMQEIYYYINDQASISYVLYAMDRKNEKASENYLYASQMASDVSDAYMKLCREIYQSDYKIKDDFFMGWGEAELKQLEGWSDGFSKLQQKHDEYVVEFNGLDPESSSFYKQTAELYASVMKNNNKMAESFGYESYADFAYEVMYLRDYTPADVEKLYGYAKQYLMPALKDAVEDFRRMQKELTAEQMDELESLISDDYDNPDENPLAGFFDSLPTGMQYYMEDLLTSERAVYMDRSVEALEGAFTVYLYEIGYPVCYFGTGYQDIFTIAHEAGHYYSMSAQLGMGNNIDLAEVYSQGNEILLLAYLGQTHIDRDVYEALVTYRLCQQLSVIITSLIIDEFEREAHGREEITLANAWDQLPVVMEEILKDYDPVAVAENIGDLQDYWHYVTIPQPMYYISYAVSGIASLSFYMQAMNDYQGAIRTYNDLVYNVYDPNVFLASLQDAGLSTPFEESTYQSFQAFLQED